MATRPIVLVLMEISSTITSHDDTENLSINVECFNLDDPELLLNLLKFKFASGKNLVTFLELHKNDILEGLDADDPALLILEEQDFLTSCNPKLSPDDIFNLAVQNHIITLKQVRNYILEVHDDYIYQLVKAPLNGRATQSTNSDISQNIQ